MSTLSAYSTQIVSYSVIGVLALLGVVYGLTLMKRPTRAARRVGRVVLVLSVMLSVGSALVPVIHFHKCFSRPPLSSPPADGVIRKGMTTDEVRDALGEPHQIDGKGAIKIWVYHLDHVGVAWYGVPFDRDGRVMQ